MAFRANMTIEEWEAECRKNRRKVKSCKSKILIENNGQALEKLDYEYEDNQKETKYRWWYDKEKMNKEMSTFEYGKQYWWYTEYTDTDEAELIASMKEEPYRRNYEITCPKCAKHMIEYGKCSECGYKDPSPYNYDNY